MAPPAHGENMVSPVERAKRSERRGRDLNPRGTFQHLRDFQSRSLDHSDTSPNWSGSSLTADPTDGARDRRQEGSTIRPYKRRDDAQHRTRATPDPDRQRATRR